MAEMDFPDSPTIGQVYDKWTWDGTMWVLTPGAAPDMSAYTVTFGGDIKLKGT